MEQKIIVAIQKSVHELYSLEVENISLNNVPKKQFGDFSFNCGILARETKKSPILIATELLGSLNKVDGIEEIQVAGAFINFKISKSIYSDTFNKIYKDKENFLSPNIGNNQTIVIDYIGMNVGKPMHIGHMCTPNIGQTMINLHKKIGYNVISDSHIGDWGIIFGKLITAFKKWGDEEKLKNNPVDYLLELYVKISSEVERDETIEQTIRDEFKKLSQGDEESKKLWAEFTSYTIKGMNKQLARLSVYPQYNVGESFYEGIGLPKMEDYPDLIENMETIVSELIEKKIATQNEDGSVGVIFEDDTKLPSCILQKRDGTHGYLASDLSCIKYRMMSWNPEKILYFVDVRQQLHFKQAFEIAKNAGWLQSEGKQTQLFHAANGFISGKEGAFSTRKGNIIKLDLLLNEAEKRAKDIILEKRENIPEEELQELSKIIGIGAIKYGHLKKSRETDMIFDWDEFMTFDGNSGPYIQYAYVRSRKILEKYGKNVSQCIPTVQFENDEEIELFKTIENYTAILQKTAQTNMPHHLCGYAYDLTKKFSTFYNNIHILNEEDEDKKILRLQLIEMFSEVLKNSFGILGIQMPEQM